MKSILVENKQWQFRSLFVVALLGCAFDFSIALAEEQPDMPSLVAQFNKFYESKQFNQAAPIAEKILQIREKTLGPDARGTAAAANN